MNKQIAIAPALVSHRPAIVQLLQSEKLPVEDLPAKLDHFFVAMNNETVVAAIGLESYGDSGLLRSLVVDNAYRNLQLASQLIKQLETAAAAIGINNMYLLTETAAAYFEKKGYQKITREEVPAALQASSEFSHVCPVSAIVMKKVLNGQKKKILVLCTGNSCRSQIAHGYLQQFAGDKATVYSAGVETHGVNPRAIAILKEDGIDISSHTSNNVNEYRDIDFDFVITVCDNAKERCPYFPSNAKKFHYNFPDPAKATGTEDEIMQQFREVREMIKKYSYEFVQENL